MDEILKICHDRVLPQELAEPQTTVRRDDRVRAVFEFRKMWINGSTLRVRFIGGTASQHALVKDQAAWWTQHANLHFDFNNALDAEIRIAFDPSDGAWSYIGTDCKKIPQGEPTMNLGFMDGGTTAHEFGHAIGLGHEHQNPAGGIEWNREAVIRDLSGPPNSWTVEQIEHNVLNKYATDQIRGTVFDGKSIMLYFFPARWTLSGVSTSANEILSNMDKEFIASTEAYPQNATGASQITVNGAPVQASIGVPGEEDVFTFKVAKAGRHTIETMGETDVVMKLFGPGNQNNLIAEDDDGGIGTNSRIVRKLQSGEYFVQMRHFNRKRGTGTYHVRVKA